MANFKVVDALLWQYSFLKRDMNIEDPFKHFMWAWKFYLYWTDATYRPAEMGIKNHWEILVLLALADYQYLHH